MGKKFYGVAHVLCSTVMRVIFPTRMIGRENIPEEGGCLLCANHYTLVDPMMLAPLTRRWIHFMAKKDLFFVPVLKHIVTWLGSFPVDRGASDISAIRKALSYLKEGEMVGIFPQGTRERKGKHPPYLSGVALIAMRADVPVVPVGISRPFRPFRVTTIRVGTPFTYSKEEKRFDAVSLEQATKKLGDAIDALRQQ